MCDWRKEIGRAEGETFPSGGSCKTALQALCTWENHIRLIELYISSSVVRV